MCPCRIFVAEDDAETTAIANAHLERDVKSRLARGRPAQH